MSRAAHLLQCALTYRNAQSRTTPVSTRFDDAAHATREFMEVLLHEAKESLQAPLETPPEHTYLHPVDIDTDEPGIVDKKEELHVLRCTLPVPNVVYTARPNHTYRGARHDPDAALPPVVHASRDEAAPLAAKEQAKSLRKAENAAASAERRKEKAEELKRQREAETPDERAARLAEAKQKREARKRAKEEKGQDAPTKKKATEPPLEDALLAPDVTSLVVAKPPPKKRKKGSVKFFEHPLPHDRHLDALQHCAPNPTLRPALLNGTACEHLEVVQGPPGTGKTRALVRRAKDLPGRVFLCAPTNVGAANLYARCLAEGMGDECALALAPERVPAGTVVESNDPTRKYVCATVSSRAGPFLHAQAFESVCVDEAAQCAEAWVWTLLRAEVEWLVLAGDVKQLPALVSESGKALQHERSLMERLVVHLDYDNVVTLTEQNRMAPEILAYPNARFYGGALTTGPYAPTEGMVEIVRCTEGKEEAVGTSWGNRAEVAAVAHKVAELGDENVVLLTAYTGQCRLLLAQKTGKEVHTIDSFQGREADTVILSVVRDGSNGLGFWADERRLVVALTRARRRLVIVTSLHDFP